MTRLLILALCLITLSCTDAETVSPTTCELPSNWKPLDRFSNRLAVTIIGGSKGFVINGKALRGEEAVTTLTQFATLRPQPVFVLDLGGLKNCAAIQRVVRRINETLNCDVQFCSYTM